MLNTKLLGGTASKPAEYVEDVFSTWLYTGNGSTQTITNGIDLAGKGGLTWIKSRSDALLNCLFDTNRGGDNRLVSSSAGPQANSSTFITSFNSNGFSLGSNIQQNYSGGTFCSWTFREAPKFFDVVTYTGNGTARTIAHNLGSTPGMIIVKKTSATGSWMCYHRSLGYTKYLVLEFTDSAATDAGGWSADPTSTNFSVGAYNDWNQSGETYVAYLFAHDAGGFGAAGTDNVISCGSFTTDGSSNATVNLGYEPQYILYKGSSGTGNWRVVDSMRGFIADGADGTVFSNILVPNTLAAETTGGIAPTATGFKALIAPSQTYIYMAIRRPMKPPTSGTQVFLPVAATIPNAPYTVTTGFPVDLAISQFRSGYGPSVLDRLRGSSQSTGKVLSTWTTSAETTSTGGIGFDSNTNIVDNYNWNNISNGDYAYWLFVRRPGFFDEVCYTGTGATNTQTHNLGVAPELMIAKSRSGTANWRVFTASSAGWLNLTNSMPSNSTVTFTTTSFTVSSAEININTSGANAVAYLFATLAGVSKVGTYTGNGGTQAIACGFTAGARFVMIKRTDSTGDWYVWDTARGIISGNDPHISLNTTAAEVTSNDSVDPDNSGFVVNQLSATNINVSSATYIFLAIA